MLPTSEPLPLARTPWLLSNELDLNAAKLAEWALSYKVPSESSLISKSWPPIVTSNSILPGLTFSPITSLAILTIDADVCNSLWAEPVLIYTFPCLE